MISKYLTIVAAVVLISGSALAQDNSTAAPASSTPAAAPAAAPAPAPAAPAPAPDIKAPSPTATTSTENPYGLGDILAKRNPVSLTILAILAVMSAGTWYIFFVKFFSRAASSVRRARLSAASGPRARSMKASTSCRRTPCSA